MDHRRDREQRNQIASPSFRTWALHWISAVLAVFLLATSLTAAFSLSDRPFGADWMDIHLSVGVGLLAITVIRIGMTFSQSGKIGAVLSSWKGAALIRYSLLFVVLLVMLTGLPIYQKPPLGGSSYLFGLVKMPTIVRLNHDLHNLFIDFHVFLSSLMLVLLVLHAGAGLKRKKGSGRSQLLHMLWPW